jgi:hypothetical protein
MDNEPVFREDEPVNIWRAVWGPLTTVIVVEGGNCETDIQDACVRLALKTAFAARIAFN